MQDLHEAGWAVSGNTVAGVMVGYDWAGRALPRRRSLTRRGRRPAARDRVRWVFAADAPDQVWCGDVTMVRTGEGGSAARLGDRLSPTRVSDPTSRSVCGASSE